MRLKGFLRSSVVVAAFLASSAVALAYSGYTTGNVNMRTGPGTGYARITTADLRFPAVRQAAA